MLPAQHNSSTTFVPHMTLASINARHSDPESPTGPTLSYPKSWIPDYAFDLGINAFQPHEFQSNSILGPHLQLDAAPSPGRAGLGIHYPDNSTEAKLDFISNNFPVEPTDAFPSFSPRLDASYSSSGLTFGDPSSNGSLNSSWSLSMIFADIPPVSESGSRGSLDPLADGSTKDLSVSEDFSLEALSAAAGLTIEEFTNKIAEGAKYALEKVADLDQGTSAGCMAHSHGPFPPLDATSFPDLPGLDLPADPWFPPPAGINPADVMPAPILSTGPSYEGMFNILGNRTRLEDPPLSFPHLSEIVYPMASTPPRMQPYSFNRLPLPGPSTPHLKDEGDQLSEYEPPAFLSPSSSEYSPSFGSSRQYQTRATRVKKRKMQPLCEMMLPNPGPTPGPSTEPQIPLPPIDLGSPVFDAHRGIEIEELKARAERYRLRNQGREYDKRWLLSYAGKLSSKGELLEEFRCYVTGCQQVNKRRDHILIHVGAHLDQRPFKCAHW